MIHDQMLLSMYQQHPEIASSPDAQSFLKKKYGADVAEGFMKIGQVQQQAQQQFGQAFGGGGAAPPSSPSAASGQGQPAGGQAQPPASPQAGAAPQQVDPIEQKQRHIQSMEQFMASPGWSNLPPDKQKAATDIYNREQMELTRMTSAKQQAAEFQQTQQRLQQNEQIMTDLRRQGMESSNEFRAASMQIRQSEVEASNQFKTLMLSMKSTEDKNAQQAHLQTAVSTLQSRAKAITALPPDQAKPLLAGFNANVKMLKKQLQDADLGDVAAGIEPLKLGETPGKLWGTNPAIVSDDAAAAGGDTPGGTAAPTATNDKGEKVQWDGKKWNPVK